ncbi:expressed unknown protein [Seminavis robusta]|uniref:Uncharacterized protein n=1 Tax=Seminavis robusta TaxID=568900 RepID=A0A9N8DBS0_9STRA|nr:expressed unknown protein [Seminavis robusta]|eukprot:Sro27_g018071.1  (181) ;mRNA; f:31343-31885
MKREDISPIRVRKDHDFYDWDSYLNMYWAPVKLVSENHCFEVDATRSMHHMFVRTFDGTREDPQLLTRLKHRPTNWRKAIKSGDWTCFKEPVGFEGSPTLLTPPGIADIKWVELYDKWRPLIPPESRTIKWFNEDPGLERRNKVSSNSEAARATRAARTKTKVSAAEAARMATAATVEAS